MTKHGKHSGILALLLILLVGPALAAGVPTSTCAVKNNLATVVNIVLGNLTCSDVTPPNGGSVEVATAADLAAWTAAQAVVVCVGACSADGAFATHTSAGIAITSTGNPTLNATYSLDDAFVNRMDGFSAYCSAHSNTFPDGNTTLTIPDLSGVFHIFPSCAAVGNFDAAVDKLRLQFWITWQSLLAGNLPVFPTNAVTIP